MLILNAVTCFKIVGVSLGTAYINYHIAPRFITMLDVIARSWKLHLFAGIQLASYVSAVVFFVMGLFKI